MKKLVFEIKDPDLRFWDGADDEIKTDVPLFMPYKYLDKQYAWHDLYIMQGYKLSSISLKTNTAVVEIDTDTESFEINDNFIIGLNTQTELSSGKHKTKVMSGTFILKEGKESNLLDLNIDIKGEYNYDDK